MLAMSLWAEIWNLIGIVTIVMGLRVPSTMVTSWGSLRPLYWLVNEFVLINSSLGTSAWDTLVIFTKVYETIFQ